MPGRNLAKPFAIAGFILAEIYMLFTVLGHYGHETQLLPAPPLAEAVAVPAGTPPPLSAKITRVVVCAVFFGPFGALVGTGVGLLVSGLRGDFRQKNDGSPTPQSPGANSPPR
ncbi:MAG: hypothetical protein ABJF10_26505 [Chthoniobacter sp.]|uniref:hypothetical protein n=1 Tax=Chthoniobacter sp. TaxID=2510640 RepID=UPI0032AA7BFE